MFSVVVFISTAAAVRGFSIPLRSSSYRALISRNRSVRLHSTDDNDEKYFKSYTVLGTGIGSAVEMETNTGHIMRTDVPIKMGGKNTAPQPVEHVLAGLIGCTQATAVYVGRMMKPRLLVDKIEFHIEGYRDERGALELPIEVTPTTPARLTSVSGTVTVHFKNGNSVTEAQLLMLKEQTEARCPVANMMNASGCKMNIKWIEGN
jgi:putative redox protein